MGSWAVTGVTWSTPLALPSATGLLLTEALKVKSPPSSPVPFKTSFRAIKVQAVV